MKKIISGIMAVSVAVCVSSGIFAATYSDEGNITVESDVKTTDSKITENVKNSAQADITTLFSWLDVDSKSASEQEIVITSEAGRVVEGEEHPYIPSEVSIKVINPDAKNGSVYTVGESDKKEADDDGISVFEYFTLTVSDKDGVVYEAKDIPSDVSELEIPLGLFNYNDSDEEAFYSDKKPYTISLRENSKLKRSNVANYTRPSNWKWYVDALQQPEYIDGTATPEPEITAAPEITITPSAEPNGSNNTDATTSPSARPTTTPRVRTTPNPRSTATPKAASASATAAPKASATPEPKTNPKTGDTVPLAGVAGLGILSLAAIAVIELKKNRG